jgi:thiol-disulfide isomerase/thioredoxin
MGMSKIEEIDEISKTKKVVVMVAACAWCNPCKLKKPTFLALKEKHPDIHMEIVDSDDEPEFKQEHMVKTLPTFIKLVGTEEVGRMEGAKQTMAQLEEWILA